jgi:hypothetical protein
MIKSAARILSLSVGATMVSFGVSQIRKPGKWARYIPGWLDSMLPTSRATSMRIHGSGNVSLGLLLIGKYKSRKPWFLAALWWAWVAPLCGRVNWRAGMRDLSILSAIIAVLLTSEDDTVS